jgi:hypothetical protein
LFVSLLFSPRFLSSIAVLTQRPEMLNRVVLTKKHNKSGVYAFRFFKNGKVSNILIDGLSSPSLLLPLSFFRFFFLPSVRPSFRPSFLLFLCEDFIPCLPDGRVAFAKSKQQGEMWVSLLVSLLLLPLSFSFLFSSSFRAGSGWLQEKAYAKLHKSFEAIEGGWVDDALADLTGTEGLVSCCSSLFPLSCL